MRVISNGRLVSENRDAATGLTAFSWSQESPHANYLISLVAGNFKKVEGRHNGVPLAFLTPPSEFAAATNSFRQTEAIMAFFEQEIGVPFPWAKYYQVCVNDFVAGGMENTSATTLTDATLFSETTENLRSSQPLVAHEMAHQWFGDLVTCKDWSHIWLNEGFATYYQILFDGYQDGHDSMLYDLYGNARGVTGMANDTNSIVRRNFNEPSEMFGYLAYPKGAWVLHMLRSQLGEDLYRRSIKTYLERHRYGNVTTEDLRAVVEELSGQSFDQFFDQWLYHAHYPELEVDYAWDELTKLAKISVRQKQALSERVLLFDFPLTIRFKGKFGAINRDVAVSKLAEDFYFPLVSRPEIVRLDPQYTLLAKTTFPLPKAMLLAQLADSTDTIGRLLAIEQLADQPDKETVAKLEHTLKQDAFYGVRIEAARACAPSIPMKPWRPCWIPPANPTHGCGRRWWQMSAVFIGTRRPGLCIRCSRMRKTRRSRPKPSANWPPITSRRSMNCSSNSLTQNLFMRNWPGRPSARCGHRMTRPTSRHCCKR